MVLVLVASALSLLVIYAGVQLLIQVKKEVLGNLFQCAAWFLVIAGFLILICAGACCIAMCCKYGMRMMHKEHKMIRSERGGDTKEYHKYPKKNMHHHHEEGECCLVHVNCCKSEMEKCCNYTDYNKRDTIKYK